VKYGQAFLQNASVELMDQNQNDFQSIF